VGTSRHLWPPGSPSPLDRTSLGRTTPISVRACIVLSVTALSSYHWAIVVQRIELRELTVHRGRLYPSSVIYQSLCDAPTDVEFSGGPVVLSNGQVIGMLLGRRGSTNAVFLITKGLVTALRGFDLDMGRIRKEVRWSWWGVKAFICNTDRSWVEKSTSLQGGSSCV
jgi:hypothetical protein